MKLLSKGSLFQSLAGGASIVLAIQVASFAVRYLSQVAFAQWLGVVEYGLFVFALAVANLLAIPASAGLPTLVLRLIPEYLTSRSFGLLRGLFRTAVIVPLAAGMLLAGLAFVFFSVDGLVESDPKKEVLQIGLGLVPLLALMGVGIQLARAIRRMVLAYSPSYIVRHLLVLGASGGLFLIGRLDAVSLIWCSAGAIILTVGLQLVLTWRSLDEQVRRELPAYEYERWAKISLPLVLVASFHVVLDQTDLVLLGVFSTAENVGIYNAALKTSVLVTFILTGINAVAAPRIATLWSTQDRKGLQSLMTTVAVMAFLPSFVLAIGLLLFSDLVLGFFGEEFVAGKVALAVLIVGRIFNAGAGAVGYLMNLTGHERMSARVFAYTAGANILLNLLLIPPFGIMGAAVATSASMILWNVWLARLTYRELRIHSSVISVFRSGS